MPANSRWDLIRGLKGYPIYYFQFNSLLLRLELSTLHGFLNSYFALYPSNRTLGITVLKSTSRYEFHSEATSSVLLYSQRTPCTSHPSKYYSLFSFSVFHVGFLKPPPHKHSGLKTVLCPCQPIVVT